MNEQVEAGSASEPVSKRENSGPPSWPIRHALRVMPWGGLSLFVLVALGHLSLTITARAKSMTGRTVLYAADRVAPPHDRVESAGLIYEGRFGFALAVVQAAGTIGLFVIAAFAHPRRRIIALSLLLLWALFWTASIGRVMLVGEAWAPFGPWFAVMLVGVISAGSLLRRLLAPTAMC